jgi:hypothetical protein
MEPKPLRFHITEGANNHIKQSDSAFFARNPIGVTYDRLPAMLTIAIHNFRNAGKQHAMGMILIKSLQRPCLAKAFLKKAKDD